jgi:hypothetical protein
MTGVVAWLFGPVFRWFAYRSEVRLWMEDLDTPIPYALNVQLVEETA